MTGEGDKKHRDSCLCSEEKKDQRRDNFLILFDAAELEEWHHLEFSHHAAFKILIFYDQFFI